MFVGDIVAFIDSIAFKKDLSMNLFFANLSVRKIVRNYFREGKKNAR